MASEQRTPGMVIDGVEHRPMWLGSYHVCGRDAHAWPCRAVVVAALKAALRGLHEKLTETEEERDSYQSADPDWWKV